MSNERAEIPLKGRARDDLVPIPLSIVHWIANAPADERAEPVEARNTCRCPSGRLDVAGIAAAVSSRMAITLGHSVTRRSPPTQR